MLSLAEKVQAMKSASLFRDTPEDVLADVASRVEELSFDTGQTVFRKGDFGDSLFIIVSGRVDVHDGSRLLAELAKGGIFGELALLDPAPRSATVKAVEPTHLLEVEESDFHAALGRPEVAREVIHVLTGYIRKLLRDDEAGAFNASGTREP